MFWQAINNASGIAQTPGKEIPGMKWGRIDFLTEIELTSRWLLFKYVPFVSSSLRSFTDPPV
jgi:hypothetical protein